MLLYLIHRKIALDEYLQKAIAKVDRGLFYEDTLRFVYVPLISLCASWANMNVLLAAVTPIMRESVRKQVGLTRVQALYITILMKVRKYNPVMITRK